MKAKTCLCAMALVLSNVAMASEYHLGNVTGVIGMPTVLSHGAGPFEDLFFFKTTAPTTGNARVSIFPVVDATGVVYGIDPGLTTSFFADRGTPEVRDAGDAFLTILGTGTFFNAGPVPGGDYYIRIAGTATGSLGGIYVAQLSATLPPTPVPENSVSTMLIGGLGLLAYMVRRRTRV